MPDTGHVLTWRQRKILRFIREHVEHHGYPPILAEIGEAVGLVSVDSVAFQITNLEREGYLTREFHRPRSIRLTEKAVVAVVFGYTAAALAHRTARVRLIAEGAVLELLPLPRQLVDFGDMFATRVADDAMRDAAILAGDIVVVRRGRNVWDGLVVADAGGEMLVRELDGDWLTPRHPDFLPTQVGEDVHILGRVVSVISPR